MSPSRPLCALFYQIPAPDADSQGAGQLPNPATLQLRLARTADTGYFYVTKKNPRTKPEKLEVRKYDPKARKHVLFREAKIK